MSVSDLWVIEYSFTQDVFGVRALSDYLRHSQESFLAGRFNPWEVLSVHPSQEACRDECAVWMDRRDKNPLRVKHRIQALREIVAGLESYLTEPE